MYMHMCQVLDIDATVKEQERKRERERGTKMKNHVVNKTRSMILFIIISVILFFFLCLSLCTASKTNDAIIKITYFDLVLFIFAYLMSTNMLVILSLSI